MKRLAIMTVLILIALLSGCSTTIPQANFQGQRIFLGQSNDSIEKILGNPDIVTSTTGAGMMLFDSRLCAQKIDPWFRRSDYIITIEWIYLDEPQSLIIWFMRGTVQALWLVDTTECKRKCKIK